MAFRLGSFMGLKFVEGETVKILPWKTIPLLLLASNGKKQRSLIS